MYNSFKLTYLNSSLLYKNLSLFNHNPRNTSIRFNQIDIFKKVSKLEDRAYDVMKSLTL